MKKIPFISFFIFLLILVMGCNKNQESVKEFTCKRLLMTGDLNRLVGTWKWENSSLEYTSPLDCFVYQSGSITPLNVGCNYFLEIDEQGAMKVFKDDSLINVYYFSEVSDLLIDNLNILSVTLKYDCSNYSLNLWQYPDSTLGLKLPDLNFNSANQSKQTHAHTFKKK